MQRRLTDNERWLLSFYRTSEISGALFFGRLAKSMSPGQIQHDMTKHFADESQHAWYWTTCMAQLGAQPLVLSDAYQDQYLAAVGLPANLMEVLALTQIFERRVIHQYARHSRVPLLHAAVKTTLDTIMQDEKWHIDWVGKALKGMESAYGAAYIADTLARYREADQAIYQHMLHEHAERVQEMIRCQQHERGEP